MTIASSSFAAVSDQDLLATVRRLADNECRATAGLIAALAELDARRLYLGQGCSSLFTYCTQVLHLSEHAAYGRIEAARAARRFPVVLERLADGEITLTAIGLLAPHLTPENHGELLDAVRHRSKREVEGVIATLRPKPPVPALVRKLPAPVHAFSERHSVPPPQTKPVEDAHPEAPAMRSPATTVALLRPLAPERYKVQFTVGADTIEKLRRAQELLRHRVPTGDVAVVFDRALTVLLEQLEKTKAATTEHPRASRGAAQGSRRIPAAVRRQVWARDGGRCAFVGACGRCTERGFLEFHHVRPYAAGGEATVTNIELRCRAHNQYEAELFVRGEAPPVVREDLSVYGPGSSVRTEWTCANTRQANAPARGVFVNCPIGHASSGVFACATGGTG
jgi:hypothetical protein